MVQIFSPFDRIPLSAGGSGLVEKKTRLYCSCSDSEDLSVLSTTFIFHYLVKQCDLVQDELVLNFFIHKQKVR